MKSENEKYCGECGEIIRKNAYICPHCGVKQSGINIDTESIGKATENLGKATFVGGIRVFILTIAFIRWVVSLAIPLGAIGGALSAAYYYTELDKYHSAEEGFLGSLAVMILVPLICSFIKTKTTAILARFGWDEESY